MEPSLIVMIGYRGSGKSTLGKILAHRLNWDYLSSDKMIEEEVGSLSQWIPRNGWPAFREREYQMCKRLSTVKQAVIDLGGGTVENQKNFKGFWDRSIIFWIDADVDTLIQRLQQDQERPLLNYLNHSLDGHQLDKGDREQRIVDEVRENYRRRLPLYQKFAHHRILNNTDTKDAVASILKMLKKYHTINL